MKINKTNVVVNEACEWAISLNEVTNNLTYKVIVDRDYTPITSGIYKRKVESIRDNYSWITNSDQFYKTNHRYLPFDLVLDLNIKMANYLCNKEIDKKYSLETARIKIPTLKYTEAIYKNPDSWQEINRKFGMTPVIV